VGNISLFGGLHCWQMLRKPKHNYVMLRAGQRLSVCLARRNFTGVAWVCLPKLFELVRRWRVK
jgi:hypothetical protein